MDGFAGDYMKCTSHDDTFKRLYARVESIDDKLDRIREVLHDRGRDADVKFVRMDMRIARCEEQLENSASNRVDIGRKMAGSLIDLLKIAAIAIVGAALWAVANGYRG